MKSRTDLGGGKTRITNTQKPKFCGFWRNLPDNPDKYADDGEEKRKESKRQAKQEAQWATIAIAAHLVGNFSLGGDRILLLKIREEDAESCVIVFNWFMFVPDS